MELKHVVKHNGIKNGVVNGTNQVINRDDKLILVPEPTKKQFVNEKILYDENKVCYLKVDKLSLNVFTLSN